MISSSAQKEVAPISKQMTIVVGLSVVGLMAFGLALSYYKNILFDRQLMLMEDRNARLKSQIMVGYSDLNYLQSTQYKDKYAKENLGLLRTGEKVLILQEIQTPLIPDSGIEITDEQKIAIYEENLQNIRVIDHWQLFLFHHDKLEELKKTL